MAPPKVEVRKTTIRLTALDEENLARIIGSGAATNDSEAIRVGLVLGRALVAAEPGETAELIVTGPDGRRSVLKFTRPPKKR